MQTLIMCQLELQRQLRQLGNFQTRPNRQRTVKPGGYFKGDEITDTTIVQEFQRLETEQTVCTCAVCSEYVVRVEQI